MSSHRVSLEIKMSRNLRMVFESVVQEGEDPFDAGSDLAQFMHRLMAGWTVEMGRIENNPKS